PAGRQWSNGVGRQRPGRRARIPGGRSTGLVPRSFCFRKERRRNRMRALILGRGNMGRAIRDALTARGDSVVGVFGRSAGDARPTAESLAPIDVTFEFSHGDDVVPNVRYALASGARAIVLGTTAWAAARPEVTSIVTDAGATLVDAPTFSVGTVLFGELAEQAARVFGRLEGYDPYVLEWHRRAKAD